MSITAEEALKKLTEGNRLYLKAETVSGDVSAHIRGETAANGQHPYAIIIACSDSRVIPEAIFMTGIGELFTIRVAGNVIGDTELGSAEYAAEHLEVPLAVVLGHTDCGAVGSALEGHTEGNVGHITQKIIKAVEGETDPCRAARRNARVQADILKEAFPSLKTVPALYDIRSGEVQWLE